ncbi:MAG: MBL fold metallo-hydrolase [Actinomycetales bacterium]|nr:MBL fold metallo-hydrolase [Actinomycetales bacterium]
MRAKLGRPDINSYRNLFNVPRASSAADLTVTWLGVSTMLVSDGQDSFMIDGFFSRPGLLSVGLGKLAPNHDRIDAALSRLELRALDAVIPVHSHYDHVMDSAEVAVRTNALMIGGTSSANVALGGGVVGSRIITVSDGETTPVAGGQMTFIASEHCPPDRYPGVIEQPVIPPVRTTAYRCGEAWSLIYKHPSGKSLLIQGSAGYRAGSLAGQQADVAYIGIGQLGLMTPEYIAEYWQETVLAVGAKRVILTHWDDFFRGLDQPLRALPFAGDDLNVTMAAFAKFAERDGVTLHFPNVWQREDPWAIAD